VGESPELVVEPWSPGSALRREVFVGATPLKYRRPGPQGGYVDIAGEPFYRIVNCDAMAPFLMSLASDSDHWMFISSTGALTAGRRDPDHALFPYCTDDRIHDSQDQSGGKTILRVTRDERTALWEPFSQRYEGLYDTTRSLSKSVYGNKVIFEEVNHDLGLSFSAGWANSERFGFVRPCTLANLAAGPVRVEVLDGIQNLMPAGLTRRFQLELSTLADGYKENELELTTGLGLFKLSSVPHDRPEPNEALRATTVWCEGLPVERRLLCSAQLDRFRRGEPVETETLVRGRRGAYFVVARLALPAGGNQRWTMVADVGQDSCGAAAVRCLLEPGADVRRQVDDDVDDGTRKLIRTVAGADGLQLTGDDLSAWRHFSNALFNIMRGGIPDSGYDISRSDFEAFVAKASRAVLGRQASFLAGLPATLRHGRLLALARQSNDPDLERLAYEYLPLTFSRRHGDPSRPWNIFAIEIKGPHGEKILNYEGNWRDIFQNWEALALSFPGYTESMIFKFADASTADGHNPYRIMRDGFDWEVTDPDDAWSYIGYWGDHQVVYLLKLLEVSARYHPGVLAGLLGRRVFTYAHVPYRIKPYAALFADPRNTIEFDEALDAEIRQRAATMGADGKALPGPDGVPYRANLAEKLLVLVLARLFNYIPEAGLWLNTQRPEWNDANNALVGNGASMVTLCFLRRFLSFCRDLFRGAGVPAVEVSSEVAVAFQRVAGALATFESVLEGPVPDSTRKAVLDSLGTAGSDYRAGLYAKGFSGERTALTTAELGTLFDVALLHIEHSIRANRRSDGLYHSYNLVELKDDGIPVSHLYEMLEGQVAVLSSGALSGAEAASLLDALRHSRLYRADQDSYLLYPDRKLPGFFERNNIPSASLAKSRTLTEMIAAGDRRIVVADMAGAAHFNAAFCNAGALAGALAPIGLPEEERAQILALYEEVFDHRSFTGRSGTFYKYEGLGSIYWHMVSKLGLAVQEAMDRAALAGEDAGTIERLRAHYTEVREGIGAHKSPDVYGAVPTDPYSHTPGFAGVQQPGMTGQVKEDLIARLGEMGTAVENGRLVFRPHLFNRRELLAQARTFHFYDVDGQDQSVDLGAGMLAFTSCQVPVVAHGAGPARVVVTLADGTEQTVEGLSLDARTSAAVFERAGLVRRLDVFLGPEARPG